jgi:hypothetical protein
MKDNYNLEDVLSELGEKHKFKDYIEINVIRYICTIYYDEYYSEFDWQLNKPFSEQSEETKTTLNKIL